MNRFRRLISLSFFLLIIAVLFQCARRGTPSGGPKDETPPVLLKTEPDTLTTNFNAEKIRLYFDEFIRLNEVQNQLIVSPPLKYPPDVSPQGGTRKYVEVVLKDTLMENTTYTLNFGQSIVDNNESNPNSFLSYVFSTGDYVDSLILRGEVKDAFDKDPDNFISIMLYEIDSAYTDSTIYTKLPNYITNTLDSATVFELRNLKAGTYSLVGVKDEGRNNLFDQQTDKIAFHNEVVNLPTDSIYTLTLFKEIPNFALAKPNFAATNKIIFGYYGLGDNIEIRPLTQLPDTVETLLAKEPEKDTINFWFTPFETDSIVFEVKNEVMDIIDTFTVKTRKLTADTLVLAGSHRGQINFEDRFHIESSIPLIGLDTASINLINRDSIAIAFSAELDSVNNKVFIDFEKEPNQAYRLSVFPNFVTDFFQQTNDSVLYRLSTGSYADFGNLRFNLEGEVPYPVILQLTNDKGETRREIIAQEPRSFEFNNLQPGNYLMRLIIDQNGNGKWDTGSFLEKRQPEKVLYYPQTIEVRANWELDQTFTVGG